MKKGNKTHGKIVKNFKDSMMVALVEVVQRRLKWWKSLYCSDDHTFLHHEQHIIIIHLAQ